MSNIELFKNKAPAAAFASFDLQSESLSDGIGGGFGVIHFTGKNWSLRMRGESHNFTRSDDGTPLAYIDVIILRQLPMRSKTYYPKGAFERGETGAPLCSSLDSLTPDATAKEPQSKHCSTCPRNETKLNAEGRMGRECRDNKRLAVLLVPNLSKALLGQPLMEPVLLRVPAASLTALSKMGDDMQRKGWPYFSFVTRIGFVAEKPYPELTFVPVQELGDSEAAVVVPMRDDALTLRITGEADPAKPRGIATEPTRASFAVTHAAEQPPPTVGRTVPPKNDLVLDLQANEPTGLGFGDTDEAPPPKKAATVVPIKQTAADTGDVEDADDALNDRIANLLKTS